MKPLVDIIILGSKPIKGMKSKGPLSAMGLGKYSSILDYQIKTLHKKININNILYVGGHGFDELKSDNTNISLIYNHKYETKNNGYSLKLGIEKTTADNLLIIFNKTIFSHQIFNFFDFSLSQIFVSDNVDYGIGCVIDETNKINNLFYNLPNRCCGIYYLASNELSSIRYSLDNYNCDNLFLFEIINQTIDNGSNYYATKILEKKMIYIIQNSKALESFKKYYAKYFSV